jgi:hypothetical protein
MNEREKEAAKAILEQIKMTTEPEETLQLANAYEALMAAVTRRIECEKQ